MAEEHVHVSTKYSSSKVGTILVDRRDLNGPLLLFISKHVKHATTQTNTQRDIHAYQDRSTIDQFHFPSKKKTAKNPTVSIFAT